MSTPSLARRVIPHIRRLLPVVLIGAIAAPPVPRRARIASAVVLVLSWIAVYVNYRRAGARRTRTEWEWLRRTSWTAFWRHYNERVPTIEQEYEIWGPYHAHRHDMRYDLVAAAAREHLPAGGRLFDLGCGSANVADRLTDLSFDYVGMDFGGPHINYAKRKYADRRGSLWAMFVRGDAERLPFDDATMDVVVMSEVIEHLLRPENAVWEISRVLKPGGVFVMTTNNASEVPLRSPLSHLLAWIEKGLGATFPSLISYRPWVWPEKVDAALLQPGSDDVYLPHTHHIQAETRRMFAAAGLDRVRWMTFEFPPPQSRMAAWFERRGVLGMRLVDILEAVAQRTPFIRRLGTHVFIVSRKTREPVAARPPAGVWPGPLSDGEQLDELDRSAVDQRA
jgi:ubiquinone/menaquinone biosynthesis C-methylase UbiE